MKCNIGCAETIDPAIGIANLRGKVGTSTEGTRGQYPLCRFHYTEIIEGRWGTVELEGWEPLVAGGTL